MGSIAISYSDLEDASSKAKKVAQRLTNYADELQSKVMNQLSKVSQSTYVVSASESITEKIQTLEDEAVSYTTYSTDLKELVDECKNTDKAVKNRISTITQSFKQNNGIANPVVDSIAYFIFDRWNDKKDKTFFGRWLLIQNDRMTATVQESIRCIKDWYAFDGGRRWLAGVVTGALTVVIAVAGIVSAVAGIVALATGAVVLATVGAVVASVVASIAAIVGGGILLVNGFVDIQNEDKALEAAADDPARAQRLSNMNSMQDVYRRDETRTENVSKDLLKANILDATELSCAVIGIVCSVGKIVNTGLKWANGGVPSLSVKEYFKADTYKNLFSKIGTGFKKGGMDLMSKLKSGKTLELGKTALRAFGKNFSSGFKNTFMNFSKTASVSDKANSVKNIASFMQNIVKGDLKKAVIEDLTLPSIGLYKTGETETSFGIYSPNADLPSGMKEGGLSAGDLFEIGGKFKDKVVENPMFDKVYSGKMMRTLSKLSTVSVSIPAYSQTATPAVSY